MKAIESLSLSRNVLRGRGEYYAEGAPEPSASGRWPRCGGMQSSACGTDERSLSVLAKRGARRYRFQVRVPFILRTSNWEAS
jgi:hypothetical protein